MLERGVRPMGFWSTRTRRLMFSMPAVMWPPSVTGAGCAKASASSSSGCDVLAQAFGHQFHQHLAHEAGFARARHARNRGEHAQRKFHVEVFKVVAGHAGQLQPAGGGARRRIRQHGGIEEKLPRLRCGHGLAGLRAGRCRGFRRPSRRRPGPRQPASRPGG